MRCEYPLLGSAMEEAGFEGIGVYITRIYNAVAQYISAQPIMNLCE